MLYFVIYAPISTITLVLARADFDCRFTYDEPSNRRKNEAEGLQDQEWLQKKPIGPMRMIQGKNLRTKSAPKHSVQEALGPG